MPYASHEDYFAEQPPGIRALLAQIQAEVEARVPGASRTIGYNMPAFRTKRTFFYFAAFKRHIGVYPPVTRHQALIAETAEYRGPKGNLSFPYGEALPVSLIGRVAAALADEYALR